MPQLFSGTRVEAIPGTPSPYGLLSVATIPETIDPHEFNGVQWNPISCGTAVATDWCGGDDVPEKIFDSPGMVDAQPVAVYKAYKCNSIGQTQTEAEEAARAGLAIGEQAALEAWFMENVLSQDAVDITPTAGTAIDVVDAVGLLEGALAINYGGVGIIHATAGSSARLGRFNQLVRDGARMRSWYGNFVALGAGYELANVGPNDTPAGEGEAWLYITGPVVARREPAVVLPNSSMAQVVNTETNDRYVLAERMYVVGYECYAAAVLVSTVS